MKPPLAGPQRQITDALAVDRDQLIVRQNAAFLRRAHVSDAPDDRRDDHDGARDADAKGDKVSDFFYYLQTHSAPQSIAAAL